MGCLLSNLDYYPDGGIHEIKCKYDCYNENYGNCEIKCEEPE